MNLSDLRKVTVKKHLRIRFPLSNGLECVVDEHGIAKVPALRAVPAFNLEQELTGAQSFVVEPSDPGENDKQARQTRNCTRDEMAALATGGAEAAHDEHED